jgi:high-affinity iron transporter
MCAIGQKYGFIDKRLLTVNLMGVGAGLLLMLCLFITIDDLSESINGTGLEWLYVVVQVLIYALVLVFIKLLLIAQKTNETDEGQQTKGNKLLSPFFAFTLVVLILALVIMLNGTNFIVYFISYWSATDKDNALFIGLILGSGICVSIGVLFYFGCTFLQRRLHKNSAEILLVLFAVGLLNQAGNLLQQIDMLPSGRAVWDTNTLLAENSELGHFLQALLGYDASPSLSQLILYIMSLILAVVWCQIPFKPWQYCASKEVIK